MKTLLTLIVSAFISLAFLIEPTAKPAQKFSLERSYSVKNTSPTSTFKIKVNIPDVVSCQNAKVLKVNYSLEPGERKVLPNGMEQLVYNLEMKAGEEKIIKLQWDIELSDVNALDNPVKQTLSEENKELYLKSGTLYECDNPLIINKTNEITTGKTTELEKAKAIYEYVKKNIKYHRFGANSKGALYALENGEGDCTEYAALIVAMCRASKIPARLNGVMALKTDTGSAGTDNHNNAEIFLQEYGWVPAEATFKTATFGQMMNFEIILRKGLRTDKGNGWFSYNVATKYNNFKEIKMLGHKWKKIS